MTSIPPIRRETVVDAAPEIAFAVFTEGIASWWPLAELGVFNDGTVAFVDGRIVETSADGAESVWGTVTEWDPPFRLGFTWHPGSAPERATAVEVTFATADARTLVTLVHRGWEVFADPQAARDEYDHGWPMVLGRYAAGVDDAAARSNAATGDHEEGAATWVALLHTPDSGNGSSSVRR